jgi:hypothetical protein
VLLAIMDDLDIASHNTKLIMRITDMSTMASTFEIFQCLVEMIYLKWEFNENKIESERIFYSDLFWWR